MSTTLLNTFKRLSELLSRTDKTTQTILRILAAVFGGYALTASVMAALALVLPVPKVDALFFISFLPALIYPAVLLWVFIVPTAQRAWRDLLIVTLAFGLLALSAAWLS
ncbi:DUF3649 domain-containing protein [Anaerospora sp.]|jgi:hypothetical protein|uniref:DUF3649 domain-containing protein n=1 Tax=Anaerospora sp. TaxID=1960278 RepID=UPI00289D8790|nr:DUF3649 domain-containing protein [Anaerospora sp.]